MIQKLMQNLLGAVKANVLLYGDIVFGSDPPYNGIAMIQAGGLPYDIHFDKGRLVRLPVLLNGKHEDQQVLLETLEAIHCVLTRGFDYECLNTEHIQVIDIETSAYPAILGREQNAQWACGSSFDITFYWR